MKEEVEHAARGFKNAFDRLKEGVLQAKDELDKDGVIQRFEFTFEILWKTLKIFLEYEGIICQSPRSCLKEAFRISLIEDEEIFLDMMEDRNRTSHIYDKETSEEIFQRIKTQYLINIESLLKKFK